MAIGLEFAEMLAAGYDLQVVNADVSWKGSFLAGDDATICVRCRWIGTTGVVIRFDMSSGGPDAEREVATGGARLRRDPPRRVGQAASAAAGPGALTGAGEHTLAR